MAKKDYCSFVESEKAKLIEAESWTVVAGRPGLEEEPEQVLI